MSTPCNKCGAGPRDCRHRTYEPPHLPTDEELAASMYVPRRYAVFGGNYAKGKGATPNARA